MFNKMFYWAFLSAKIIMNTRRYHFKKMWFLKNVPLTCFRQGRMRGKAWTVVRCEYESPHFFHLKYPFVCTAQLTRTLDPCMIALKNWARLWGRMGISVWIK